jgi:hypothetical protein
MSYYDMSIHHNPSGAAWAKFFMEMKNKVNFEIDEDLMLGWFCNAMEAMSNYKQKEIDSLKTQLAEAEKVIEFYGDLDNWKRRKQSSSFSTISIVDMEDTSYGVPSEYGGKRARGYLEKYKETK